MQMSLPRQLAIGLVCLVLSPGLGRWVFRPERGHLYSCLPNLTDMLSVGSCPPLFLPTYLSTYPPTYVPTIYAPGMCDIVKYRYRDVPYNVAKDVDIASGVGSELNMIPSSA